MTSCLVSDSIKRLVARPPIVSDSFKKCKVSVARLSKVASDDYFDMDRKLSARIVADYVFCMKSYGMPQLGILRYVGRTAAPLRRLLPSGEPLVCCVRRRRDGDSLFRVFAGVHFHGINPGTGAGLHSCPSVYGDCTRDFIQMGNKPVLPILSWESSNLIRIHRIGIGPKGLGRRFLTLTERALKE